MALAGPVLEMLPPPGLIWSLPRILTPELGGNGPRAPLSGQGVVSTGTQRCLQPRPHLVERPGWE